MGRYLGTAKAYVQSRKATSVGTMGAVKCTVTTPLVCKSTVYLYLGIVIVINSVNLMRTFSIFTT